VRALRGGEREPIESIEPPETPSLLHSWGRGALTILLNPKIGAFYVAVLPQFIPPHDSHLAVGLLLAGVHAVEGAVWFTAIILATQSVRSLLRQRNAKRAIDGTTGAVLIGFGIKLATSAR
jgi:threonine/homoserine/homoserine lactone efflux protein